ncbi:MAG: glycosyltransferase family 39 protein [Chloroflexia bacterium]
MNGGDAEVAARLYWAAIILLILVLLHPAWPWHREQTTQTASQAADVAVALPAMAAPAVVARPAGARPARAAVAPAATPVAARIGLWALWQGIRGRWGWRITVPGLVLSLGLAGGATLLLRADIADARGGWLWAAALATLILTFAGAPRWPRGVGGLLPGPEDDFFGRGVPRPALRWEIVLAAGVIALALVLRLMNLEYMPGIFGDEGERGMDARAIVEGHPTLLFGYGWWGVPNLYFYWISWMLRLFGDNMVGDRMVSVISGVVTVWLVYRIGRLLWGPRVGLVAGALLAVSPLWLQYSREAGESTPTAMCWAGGFLFLFRALRFRRWSDWVFAGLCFGFSLYFYAAGKLVVPMLAVIVVYCLIRWRLAFFKRYLFGFVLSGVAFGLAFLPYALFLITDNWHGFFGRAQETSIFSAQNQALTFNRLGVPYDASWAGQTLQQSLLSHPWQWALLIFQQARIASEVLYRIGDSAFFYTIQLHHGTLLSPVLAFLTVLGLAYATWKLWDGRFGLLLIWFWGGMAGIVMTIDAPNVQRLVGAWPVVFLFPAVLIDRISAGAWPISRALARRWSTIPLAGLIVFAGVDGYQEYFVSYAAQCPFCIATVQARYVQALGQDYKGYQMGVGGYDIYFGYGSTRFVAKGVEGDDLNVPMDFFPITDNNGKGAAFLVYPSNAQYLPIIRAFYPGGSEEAIKGNDGSFIFTSYKVSSVQMAAFETAHAAYQPAQGAAITRDEPNLGTKRASNAGGGTWAPPAGLAYPVTATWQGGLVAPTYGLYTFVLKGAQTGQLDVDGKPVLDAATPINASGDREVVLVLAKGIHDVRLGGTLSSAQGQVDLEWAAAGASLPIAARYLYNGSTGGLSGTIGVGAGLDAADPLSGQKPSSRRSDPFLGVRDTGAATSSLNQPGLLALWKGTIQIPTTGTYQFSIDSSGPSLLKVDNEVVLDTRGISGSGTGGIVSLAAGAHDVDLRYNWPGGSRGNLEWYWTPPGGARTIVPMTVLTPAARSWRRGEVPDPTTQPNLAPEPQRVLAIQPAAVLGADAGMREARGVGVDSAGHIYIGDNGNHRVLVLDKDGKRIGEWGGATDASAAGKINLLGDLWATPDGHVLTIDSGNGDLQEFTSSGQVVQQLAGLAPASGGLAMSADGQIWVAHTGGSNVLRLGADGKVAQELVGGADGTRARLEQPIDVVVAPDGTVYAVDMRQRIVQLNSAGQIVHEWPVEIGLQRGGSHLAYWKGRVVMCDPDRSRLVMLDPTTGQMSYLGGEGAGPGQFRMPVGLAVGPDNRLYVLDSDNARVQVFTDLPPR